MIQDYFFVILVFLDYFSYQSYIIWKISRFLVVFRGKNAQFPFDLNLDVHDSP